MHGKHRSVAQVIPDGATYSESPFLNAHALADRWDIDPRSKHEGLTSEMYRGCGAWVTVNKAAVRQLAIDNGVDPSNYRTKLEVVRALDFKQFADEIAAEAGVPASELFGGMYP